MDNHSIKQLVAGIGIAGLVAGTTSLAGAAEHVHQAPATDNDKPATEAGPSGCGGMEKCPKCQKMKSDKAASGCGGAMKQPITEQTSPAKPGSSGCGGASGFGGATKPVPETK
ncbi:MAG: hypothetical protein WBI04_10705 [Trichlorobacter sp.]|jgi:radical SAM modification target selenobiotic family peptide